MGRDLEEELYIIPHNYTENGKILGIFDKKALTVALIWFIPTAAIIYNLPIDKKIIKTGMFFVISILPAAIVIMGIDDEPILNILKFFLKFNKKKKLYIYKK